MNKANATNIDIIEIRSIEWCVPQCNPSIPRQAILSKQILSKVPTELHYVEESVFMKDLITQTIWSFEMGTQEGIHVPIWNLVGSEQKDKQYSQNFSNNTFYRTPVTGTHCVIGIEK